MNREVAGVVAFTAIMAAFTAIMVAAFAAIGIGAWADAAYQVPEATFMEECSRACWPVGPKHVDATAFVCDCHED